MELLPEWAPNIHPLIIHFPIAILSLAVGLTILELFYAREWLIKSTAGLYVVGLLGALASYISGRFAADSIGLNLKAEMAISTHSDWALYTLVFFSALTVVYGGVKFVLKDRKMLTRIVLAILAISGFLLLAQTAEYGGRLVFEFGLGVQK